MAIEDKDGVWRTIRRRRVFIKDGESLEQALERSKKAYNSQENKAVGLAKKVNENQNQKQKVNNKSFETKKQARDYFEQISKKWENALNDFEKESIKGYTDLTYNKINTYLRNPKEVYIYRNFNKQEIEKQIQGIDAAISKFDLPNDIVVYRGTNIMEFGKDLNDIEDLKKLIGEEITLTGYSSTSTDKGVADRDFDGEVLIEYNIPKGKGKGAYLEFISTMKDLDEDQKESEFLLKRNSKIKINEVEERQDGKILVSAEVI